MTKSTEHQGEFEQQRHDYASRLPGVIANINETWQKLCNISWDDDEFSKLSISIHKLAGTARNYGFKEAGQLAILLDQAFRKIETTSLPTEAEKQQIKARLEELILLASKPGDTESINLPEAEQALIADVIYIVDDDEDASRFFEVILKSAGYITEVFPDLDDFHQAFKQKQPDLIIMDIVFPEGKLAGIEAINQLGTELGKSIPIIFVSVRSDVQARIRALRAGGCAYITKPVDPETLLSVVANNSSIHQDHKRILVIDDDPASLIYLEALIKNNQYEVSTSESPVETLQKIESFCPDIVVMDYNMPDYNGEELVKMLRQDQRYINLPVIMITGDKSPEIETKVSQLSNTRFLTKPIDNDVFLENIAESIQTAFRSQKLMLDILKHYPIGLSNLYYFYSELESIIAVADSREKPYTLLYFAIDKPEDIRQSVGLKQLVNLNKKISSYLLSLIGKNELISQLTEFVYLVLIHADDESTLTENIDSLRSSIEKKAFKIGDINVSVSASVGAISISSKINSVDDAVSLAERASIEASRKGGNQVVMALSNNFDNASVESTAGNTFVDAFKGDNLHLRYQPIVNINTSESAYEAFARFTVEGKTLTPQQFMPYIEEYNLEFEFNKKITNAAIHDIFRSSNISYGKYRSEVIIKLVPTHKTMSDFMSWFESYLKTNNIKTYNKLIFSFREDWVLKHHDSFKLFMKKSREHNCGLALGHTGLSQYTADLVEAVDPVFTILSPDFTKQLISNYPGNSKEVLKRLQTTNSRIVASSVENADTFAKLMALGIYYFQGYILQEPDSGLDFSISEHFI